eukprot:CAMPEP_0197649178 /NCGR_PEP_ID=MMETSP1338-20131121/28196_1 /TAXON_ID=43686 ORGANISM="Pelagodinium beii, Strain RCC1491" /NCGR_SAMPLE_ID=MMETSP1338 /ASSEMBLY_ACC=CAM_ASM_000754 /LENGTH=478 /DNA_ID=CAMNT_0043223303 /DNA_START=52 /DNA_END=1485 /DNA_ORIENTATION=-
MASAAPKRVSTKQHRNSDHQPLGQRRPDSGSVRISEWYESNGSLRTSSAPPTGKSPAAAAKSHHHSQKQRPSVDDLGRPSSWRSPPGSARETPRSSRQQKDNVRIRSLSMDHRQLAITDRPDLKPTKPTCIAWPEPVKCIEAWPEPCKRTEPVCFQPGPQALKVMDWDGTDCIIKGQPVNEGRSTTWCSKHWRFVLALVIGFVVLLVGGCAGVLILEGVFSNRSPSRAVMITPLVPDASPSSATASDVPAELPMPQVSGVLALEVEEVQSFIHDARASRAVKTCIARTLAVEEDSMQVHMRRSGRLLRGRRLSFNLEVDYTIILQGGAEEEASQLVKQVELIQPESMSSQLANDLHTVGLDTSVEVLRMTGSVVEAADTTSLSPVPEYALQFLTISTSSQVPKPTEAASTSTSTKAYSTSKPTTPTVSGLPPQYATTTKPCEKDKGEKHDESGDKPDISQGERPSHSQPKPDESGDKP